mmetsp:Transcript_574/g.760  ORF Transcript_574/g.760 Transcript_574/m.760 type:complete len:85 (-) Transcript_574:77-331(-)
MLGPEVGVEVGLELGRDEGKELGIKLGRNDGEVDFIVVGEGETDGRLLGFEVGTVGPQTAASNVTHDSALKIPLHPSNESIFSP